MILFKKECIYNKCHNQRHFYLENGKIYNNYLDYNSEKYGIILRNSRIAQRQMNEMMLR